MVDYESNFDQLMRGVKLSLASRHRFAQLIGLPHGFIATEVVCSIEESFKERGQVKMK
jgi:hypothetical protein